MILGGGNVDQTVITRDWPYGSTVHVPYVSLAATDGVHRVVIDNGAYEVDTMKKSDFFSQDLRSSNRLLGLRHHKDIRCPAPSTYSKQKPAKRRNGLEA